MQYGICHLSIVPVRTAANHMSDMTSQLLYGEYFKVLEERQHWSRIRNNFDGFEGWVHNHQYRKIEEVDFENLEKDQLKIASDLVEYIADENQVLMSIPLGAQLNYCNKLKHHFEGNSTSEIKNKGQLLETALLYLNAPEFYGGKTPFGIDSSGFTQMVYKLNGYKIKRTASEQAKEGEALSFIEESEPGDLVFFDDNEGVIDHVGIIMQDHYVIHVDGKVRMDRIDHSGIFNMEYQKHTHKLRVIKKII
ncbi:C40 family peptidase [Gramella sp. AN32]|uniref:NlpC/P60 family protein n=1 Tax=Christiangramia antarctica TaxID=2058158 RepID=A0ABW5XCM8_9FLAO|nr:C40 family peptidase [Gramella sp. AN32]MCM4157385.1 hydrolase Nlp/P60 [Gramella sp. AN32]